jgi:hypothetical protein
MKLFSSWRRPKKPAPVAAAPLPLPPEYGAPRRVGRVAADLRADPFGLLPDGVEGARRLPPDAAARAFVAWMQERRETGVQSHRRLAALYGQHCLSSGHMMLPPNVFFAALKGLCGPSFLVRAETGDGTRRRVTVYEIPTLQPAPEAPAEAVRPAATGQRRTAA